jgi:hypothetical protein
MAFTTLCENTRKTSVSGHWHLAGGRIIPPFDATQEYHAANHITYLCRNGLRQDKNIEKLAFAMIRDSIQ